MVFFSKRRGVPDFISDEDIREFKRSKGRLQQEKKEEFFESEKKRVKRLKQEQKLQKDIAKLRKPKFSIRKQVKTFGQAMPRQEEPFSHEQEAMQSMFGHGSKMWGTEMDPVKINHDLNPRRRGDSGTAEMFGFG